MFDESIEIEAANEDEATRRACEALNTRIENLGYEITAQGKKRGLMGLIGGGGGKVKIRAWRKDARGEESIDGAAKEAKEVLENIIKHITPEYEIETREQSEAIVLNISTDEGGLVIGKNGQTLDAVQFLVRKIVARTHGDNEKQIIVNTEGYRERRRDTLVSIARKVASRVRKSRRKEALKPMNPYDRRIVHLAIQEERGVVSVSEGEGNHRCIVVMPESKRGNSRGNEQDTRRQAE